MLRAQTRFRALVPRRSRLRQFPQGQDRQVSRTLGRATTPVAEQLDKSGLWKRQGQSLKPPKGDNARVNIVDEKLCDDVLEYIKPTLERHVGCDIVDLYPGVGLWSRKLHELLKPRSHLLLEPNTDIYAPFLEPLLSKPNTRLVPKSGIVWKDLNNILTPEYLPHQVAIAHGSSEPPPRNDTLLVTANLAFFPKRKWAEYTSLATLLLFQFLRSIRTSALFQKYGQVRMLMWIDDTEKNAVIPRSLQRRRRAAIDAEMCTEWITEVAGTEGQGSDAHFHRWRSIDAESMRKVLERMREQGTVIPPGRESKMVQELISDQRVDDRPAYSIDWPFYEELERLEREFAEGKFTKVKKNSTESPLWDRLKKLRYRVAAEEAVGKDITVLLGSYNRLLDRLKQARTAVDEEERQRTRADASQLLAAFEHETQATSKLNLGKFFLARDNLHVFHQDPPVLSWDRRRAEPLVVKPTEFFPNHPCALIDIQPRAVHPLLRQLEGSNTLDAILPRMLLLSPPLAKVFDSLAPGAADGVLSQCSKLLDPSVGGIPIQGRGQLWPRAMNEAQIIEVLERWLEWPFAPTFAELVARAHEDVTAASGDEDDHGKQAPTYDLA